MIYTFFINLHTSVKSVYKNINHNMQALPRIDMSPVSILQLWQSITKVPCSWNSFFFKFGGIPFRSYFFPTDSVLFVYIGFDLYKFTQKHWIWEKN